MWVRAVKMYEYVLLLLAGFALWNNTVSDEIRMTFAGLCLYLLGLIGFIRVLKSR